MAVRRARSSVSRIVYASLAGLFDQPGAEGDDLGPLDDRLLKDIGVSRLDAWQEFYKPFWRP